MQEIRTPLSAKRHSLPPVIDISFADSLISVNRAIIGRYWSSADASCIPSGSNVSFVVY